MTPEAAQWRGNPRHGPLVVQLAVLWEASVLAQARRSELAIKAQDLSCAWVCNLNCSEEVDTCKEFTTYADEIETALKKRTVP